MADAAPRTNSKIVVCNPAIISRALACAWKAASLACYMNESALGDRSHRPRWSSQASAPIVKPEGRRSHGDAAEKWPTAATRREQPLANVQGSRRVAGLIESTSRCGSTAGLATKQADNHQKPVFTRQHLVPPVILTRYAQSLHACTLQTSRIT